MLIRSTKLLSQLQDIIQATPDDIYTRPCETLSNASIGAHTRHIIEMYEALANKYECATIDYEGRPRNKQIEMNTGYASKRIEVILKGLNKSDKPLQIETRIDDQIYIISTSYYRELLYNFEHAIHHEALIRIAIEELTDISLPKSFGVAPATLLYREQCAR
jgi:hypothetical protein